ncbi:glyoxalase [uncultured Aquimarina sp.]|uniref:glyoxalase n=1 Tax=uncultured Aquimarina sp. TaxID=575652 RepID=UPI00262D5CDE|nr:glyoxalase [uncultured Aquimarina sp.]
MENRESNLLAIRPQILNAKVSENMSNDEQFQNKTIRPIIKLQNELLIEVFRNYIKKRKNTFYELSLEKRILYIDNAIQKDMKFRNSLKGMIIGQYTVDEYLIYIENSSALNKRMMNIVRERLQSNIQLLERPLTTY